MEVLNVKVQKLNRDAILPVYASQGAACFDLHACLPDEAEVDHYDVGRINEGESRRATKEATVVGTGLAFEIPEGHVMLIFSRSGHGFKNQVRLSNCVGVIDSDYRGEVKVSLVSDNHKAQSKTLTVKHGDRIAQAMIVPLPAVQFEEVPVLSETDRGQGGFGSTGN